MPRTSVPHPGRARSRRLAALGALLLAATAACGPGAPTPPASPYSDSEGRYHVPVRMVDMRFEPYSDIDAEDIAQAVGQEVPERYTLIGVGRMFPQAIDSDTFVPLDTDRARELIQIIRDIES